MSGFNVPDDWAAGYDNCRRCGARTHASEGHACPCDDELDGLEHELDLAEEEKERARTERDWNRLPALYERCHGISDDIKAVNAREPRHC